MPLSSVSVGAAAARDPPDIQRKKTHNTAKHSRGGVWGRAATGTVCLEKGTAVGDQGNAGDKSRHEPTQKLRDEVHVSRGPADVSLFSGQLRAGGREKGSWRERGESWRDREESWRDGEELESEERYKKVKRCRRGDKTQRKSNGPRGSKRNRKSPRDTNSPRNNNKKPPGPQTSKQPKKNEKEPAGFFPPLSCFFAIFSPCEQRPKKQVSRGGSVSRTAWNGIEK